MLIEILKTILIGIVEGITEWLPVSSTGHMILLEEFVHLNMTEEFMEMFNVVIQLGAIFAVIVLFFPKLWPFTTKEKGTGLGLSISRQFVQENGGTMDMDSTTGSGTTITLRFKEAKHEQTDLDY